MSKLTPITSRAKMNGGIIKGRSGCGCGGDCGCASPTKMWGAAKVAHGKKSSPAKMCGPKHK